MFFSIGILNNRQIFRQIVFFIGKKYRVKRSFAPQKNFRRFMFPTIFTCRWTIFFPHVNRYESKNENPQNNVTWIEFRYIGTVKGSGGTLKKPEAFLPHLSLTRRSSDTFPLGLNFSPSPGSSNVWRSATALRVYAREGSLSAAPGRRSRPIAVGVTF